MEINGRLISDKIKKNLIYRIEKLKSFNIIPTLAVILAGNNQDSLNYIKHKKKFAQVIGASVLVKILPVDKYLKKNLTELSDKYNNDAKIHGIIIQRPVQSIESSFLDHLIVNQKDVDGFNGGSKFIPPIANALFKMLEFCQEKENSQLSLIDWLNNKKMLLIGRGEAGGQPIINTLIKYHIQFKLAHSRTKNIEELISNSDIIVSSVGKPNIVRHDMLKNKPILIGIGITNINGKLGTDYEIDQISAKTSFYSKNPGGIGPVNIACLFQNLLDASEEINNKYQLAQS